MPQSIIHRPMENIKNPKSTSALVIMASLVIVIAGIKTASSIIVPFLMALFIVIIFKPFSNALKKKGVPGWLALTVILLIILIFIGLMGTMVTVSVQDFTRRLPIYNEKLLVYRDDFLVFSEKIGLKLDQQQLDSFFDPAKIMIFVAGTLKSFSDILSKGFLILLTIVFIFIESNIFSDKLRFITKDKKKILYFYEINDQLNHYMMIKTITSASTGIILGGVLALAGVDYALLWGMIAFLLNYIPSIGSLIAAIPPIIFALIQFGVKEALAVTALYALVNFIIGSVLEPRIMGKGLGLSVLVVFLSLVFWGWVLGPVGMFLSVPLTLVIKIILQSQPETYWIAVLLGSGKEINPTQKKEILKE